MRSFFKLPERTEKVVIKLTMDRVAYDRLKLDVESMGIKLGRVEEFDTVNIEYDFIIEYYNTVAQFRSLMTLLNDPSVSAAMIGSRDALNLLFVDLIDTIRNVQKSLETVESQ